MAVVREFPLPDLGEGLTEATIVRWLVEVGEVVAVDQPVVEVETAKAMVEVPCPYGGVVTARMGEEGDELPVGAPLVTVAVGTPGGEADPGTDGDARTQDVGAPSGGGAQDVGPSSGGGGRGAGSPAPSAPGGAGGDEGSGNVLVGYGTSAAAARRRRVRPAAGARGTAQGAARGPAQRAVQSAWEEVGVRTAGEAAGVTGGTDAASRGDSTSEAGPASVGGGVAVVTEGGGAPGALGPVPVISPLVRRLAREHGVDLRAVRGSGPDGLILRADVERALQPPETAGVEGPAGEAAAGSGAVAPGLRTAHSVGAAEAERVPLKGMRGAAAEKFSRSRREIPEATCWVDADATELLAVRRTMNTGDAPKVSLLALLARICTAALARYPELNSTVDPEKNEIVRLSSVHLGFAAQTDRGLVVPVVRDAHARTVEGLSAEMARLTGTARAGRLGPAELTHGTFTLNNYGVFGVDGSTPIINHPEAAMLGVGRIAAKPWVHEGELAVRHVVQLSLTFDHRVCDGGTAGGFLRFVADCVERPAILLRSF